MVKGMVAGITIKGMNGDNMTVAELIKELETKNPLQRVFVSQGIDVESFDEILIGNVTNVTDSMLAGCNVVMIEGE